MSWLISYDSKNGRDIGYGVPSLCDHPGCNRQIDRGLSYVCGGEPYGGDVGCGLFFCSDHLRYSDEGYHQMCERCFGSKPMFEPKPDTADWLRWKITDESWQQWRDENPDEVTKIKQSLQSD